MNEYHVESPYAVLHTSNVLLIDAYLFLCELYIDVLNYV